MEGRRDEQEPRGVVIGCSAGGMGALLPIVGRLPADYPLPLLLVQHLHKTDDGRFAEHLGLETPLSVREANDKETLAPGRIYVAPPNYHLMVERNDALALSIDPRVNWSRPSIDVLFESAARAWGAGTVAVILSGANQDGARGMQLISECGGLCIAQDPVSAPSPVMPRTAIAQAGIDLVLPPSEIGEQLVLLGERSRAARERARKEQDKR